MKCRWFFDTEFLDDGKTIELISIALVPEDPKLPEYYAESSEFDWGKRGTEWLRKHVLPNLKPGWPLDERTQIARQIQSHILRFGKPEFWGYFPSYDWVVFCQLYGAMVDMPEPFPHRPNDLAQLMAWHGIKKTDLPPMPTTHNALDDARWNRDAWCAIQEIFKDAP
jgi:3' exoribonuclease, RNase T-like